MTSSPSKLINLGLIQMSMTADPSVNLDHATEMISQAAKRQARIVCLPELFRSTYFAQTPRTDQDDSDAFTEPLIGEVSTKLSALAKKLGIVIIAGSIYERTNEKNYNTSLVFNSDGSILGHYRKVHIPQDPCYYEKDYFSEGDLGFRIFDTPFCKVAVLICYDQWFPEAARAVALSGADVVFYPTAIGTVEGIPESEGSWQEAWENVQRGHAIANSFIVAAVNRVGKEGNTTFWGGSFVCNAFGKTLVRGSNREEVLIATVDLDHSKYVRDSWGFFRNRRPNTYTKLVE